MNTPEKQSPEGNVVLIGIPWDENSSYMRGPAQAPPLIRSALNSTSTNLTSETGISLDRHPSFSDAGDLDLSPSPDVASTITEHISAVVADGGRPLVLGGDHAVSYPVIQAVARRHPAMSILHFDAHPDLYDVLDANRMSHACPFARIMEEGLAKRLVQVGIRTLNDHQREQAARFGVEVHEMRSFSVRSFMPRFDEPIYISFDLDALDPAFAPGVSHFEPGGLSVRDVLDIIHRIKAPVVGADIVEYNPRRDPHHMTAMVAAKLIKEIAGVMLRHPV